LTITNQLEGITPTKYRTSSSQCHENYKPQKNATYITREKQQLLTKEIILQTLQNHSNFFEKYDIKTLALFGSTARNEATENSDLDFLVEFNHPAILDSYMDLKF
jgi:predicted nucleotidyltransferase